MIIKLTMYELCSVNQYKLLNPKLFYIFSCIGCVFFTSDAIHNRFHFIHQINVLYGSGGMLCSFENNQLVDFFHFLKRNIDERLPIKKAVFYPSQLTKNVNKVWILGPTVQINEEGDIIDDINSSDFVWLPKAVTIQEPEKLPPQIDVSCFVNEPLNHTVLAKFFEILKGCLQHMIMMFHCTTVREIFSGCSIPVAMGPSETGKSTAIRLGLALFGLEE